MLGLVSVQTGLEEVKAHLENSGYTVVDMAEAVHPVEAVVYTGDLCAGDSGNCSSTGEFFTVMVNAAGLSPEQVVQELAIRMGQRHVQDLPGTENIV